MHNISGCRLTPHTKNTKYTQKDSRHTYQLKLKPKTVDQQLLFYKLIFMKQFTKCFYSKRLFHMCSLGADSNWCSDACTNNAQIAVQSKQPHRQFTYCNAIAATKKFHEFWPNDSVPGSVWSAGKGVRCNFARATNVY